jgi:dihydrofolate reductase
MVWLTSSASCVRGRCALGAGDFPVKALAAIFAISENGVIGRGGQLPWDFPEDRAHFMNTTMGHAVIMGRRTFEERGEPLEGRTNIVVSRSSDVKTLEEALRLAWSIDDEPFVIGGVRIFEEAMPLVTRVFVTDIPGSYEGDAVLRFDRRPFRVVSSRIGEHGLRFSLLERDAV